MIKLGLVSDLHTEFWQAEDRATISEVVRRRLADADLVLLPGDLGIGRGGIAIAQALFADRPLVCVAGNHEFYDGDYESVLSELQATDAQVHFLHNSMATFDLADTAVRVFGTTLWTDFDLHGNAPLALLDAQMLSDFRWIRYRDRTLTPADTLAWHREQRAWLLDGLNTKFDGMTIVMTHHAPVSFAISPKYVNDQLSPCFASRMETLLVRDDVSLVVWGHTHHCVDRTIETTRFVSNQTGYPGWFTGSDFPTETGEFGQMIVLGDMHACTYSHRA